MITLEQYFGGKPHTAEQYEDAKDMLGRVNRLCNEAVGAGAFTRPTCPNTGTEISGSKGGQGDGGFRLPDAGTGAPNSSHKQAKAVDQYDPGNRLDTWLDQFDDDTGGNSKLAEHGLYREHPDATPGWCHLTTRPPHSNKRTFRP